MTSRTSPRPRCGASSASPGAHLHALAWGRDERPVTPRREEKSVGAEETFPADVDDPEVIKKELLRLSGRTAQALRAAGCVARTVTVKLRLASFKTITRSRTLGEPTDVAREIYTAACALYEGSGLDGRARLRLVGVRATGLRPATGRRAAAGVRRPPGGLAGSGAGGGPDRQAIRDRRGAAGGTLRILLKTLLAGFSRRPAGGPFQPA